MRHVPTVAEPTVLSPAEVDALAARLAARCRDLPVSLLYLHGSHAHGTQNHLSDLDLAMVMDRDSARDRDARAEIRRAIEDICERDDVDLVILNTAGPIIADRVVRHGRLLYARSEAERVAFEAMAIKAALDFQPFSNVYDKALFRQLQEATP